MFKNVRTFCTDKYPGAGSYQNGSIQFTGNTHNFLAAAKVSVRLCRYHRNAVRSSRTFGALSSFGGEAARLNRRLDERKKMEGEQDESGIEQSNG